MVDITVNNPNTKVQKNAQNCTLVIDLNRVFRLFEFLNAYNKTLPAV
jgi:hypothetical protein